MATIYAKQMSANHSTRFSRERQERCRVVANGHHIPLTSCKNRENRKNIRSPFASTLMAFIAGKIQVKRGLFNRSKGKIMGHVLGGGKRTKTVKHAGGLV